MPERTRGREEQQKKGRESRRTRKHVSKVVANDSWNMVRSYAWDGSSRTSGPESCVVTPTSPYFILVLPPSSTNSYPPTPPPSRPGQIPELLWGPSSTETRLSRSTHPQTVHLSVRSFRVTCTLRSLYPVRCRTFLIQTIRTPSFVETPTVRCLESHRPRTPHHPYSDTR